MDDRRFDSLARSLANGASRRSVLKGMLGFGSAAVAGGVLLDGAAEAARRPTPTPTPPKCPGNQIPSANGSCVCPGTAPNKCGPACCTAKPGDPPSPTHTECCDNACCHGTCYGEELCCPTNPRGHAWDPDPPTHQVCRSAQGAECCPTEQDCCEVDGCCDTVCWGGEDGNSNCCPPGAFCAGNDSPDLCCTNNFICCGAGTSGNLCRNPSVQGGCCTTDDCSSGQVCEGNLCVTPCTETVPVFVHAPFHGCNQGTNLAGVPVEIYDCESGERLYGPVSTNNDGFADFLSIPPGVYCMRVPEDSSYNGCEVCLDVPLYRSSFEVVCGRTPYPMIGICQQGQHCDDGECVDDDPCDGRCTDLEVCVDSSCSCKPGTYDDFNGNCILCGPGTYADSPGAFECAICGLNTYQDQSGQTGCVACPDGTYTGYVGSTSAGQCLACNCPAGNMPAVCNCPVVCDIGSAPDESGTCQLCAAGTFSPQGTACNPCAAGSYANQVGATACLVCDCGTTCNPITGTCPSGGLPDTAACQQDADCQSGHCGCDAPPGFPECFCRVAECRATGADCAGSAGAVVCCEGDCTCFNGLTNCVCTVPV